MYLYIGCNSVNTRDSGQKYSICLNPYSIIEAILSLNP
jgi:hypothetical protein